MRLGDLIAMAIAAYRELNRKNMMRYHVTLSATLDYALEEALDAVRDLKGYVKNLEDTVMSYELMIEERKSEFRVCVEGIRYWRRAYQQLAMKYIDQIMGEVFTTLLS